MIYRDNQMSEFFQWPQMNWQNVYKSMIDKGLQNAIWDECIKMFMEMSPEDLEEALTSIPEYPNDSKYWTLERLADLEKGRIMIREAINKEQNNKCT